MKKLILLGGAMGVGKSAVSRELAELLTPSVYLDGDWCWNLHPFVVNAENKAMVMGNITHLLRAFLSNSGLEYVIFCWVMHQRSILEDILAGLAGLSFVPLAYSLTASEAALRQRIQADVAAGLRQPDVLERSLARLPLYDALPTVKLDTTGLTPRQAAERIARAARDA